MNMMRIPTGTPLQDVPKLNGDGAKVLVPGVRSWVR